MRDQKQKTSINALPNLAPLEKLILNKNKLQNNQNDKVLINYSYVHLFKKKSNKWTGKNVTFKKAITKVTNQK